MLHGICCGSSPNLLLKEAGPPEQPKFFTMTLMSPYGPYGKRKLARGSSFYQELLKMDALTVNPYLFINKPVTESTLFSVYTPYIWHGTHSKMIQIGSGKRCSFFSNIHEDFMWTCQGSFRSFHGNIGLVSWHAIKESFALVVLQGPFGWY